MRQQKIPGTIPPHLAEIDESMEAVEELRDEKKQIASDLEKAEARLVSLMAERGLLVYQGARYLVRIEAGKTKAKIARIAVEEGAVSDEDKAQEMALEAIRS